MKKDLDFFMEVPPYSIGWFSGWFIGWGIGWCVRFFLGGGLLGELSVSGGVLSGILAIHVD